LGNLTRDNDENVRLWSAAHLLKLEEKIALAELAHLAKDAKSWMVRSSADVTATEWRKGSLDID
jgi:HEAT repeat protein